MHITQEEYDKIMHELAERWIDLVMLKAEQNIRKVEPKQYIEHLLSKDGTFELTHKIIFIVNDLHQILSRLRRNKTSKNRKRGNMERS